MGKSLVIVESPNKTKTISKYLGNEFVVKSSRGHIRDLPTSGAQIGETKTKRIPKHLSPKEKKKAREKQARTAHIRRMGVDPDNGWIANWIVSVGKDSVVKDLKKAAEGSDFIYLATDRDREGEAIAWHLQEVIGGDSNRFRRVVFNEITKSAIDEAFRHPGTVNNDRVNAYKARRFLDRVVGFELSPLLWNKVARGLSAGRVQSVAVRLVVEREREIRAFNVEEYWELFADLARSTDESSRGQNAYRFKVITYRGRGFSAADEQEAEKALKELEKATCEVIRHEKRPTGSKPQPPFITSTLQQAASSRLGYTVARTMRLAQSLYESGLITYMRTDSTNLAGEAVSNVRDYLNANIGSSYVPNSPVVYPTKSKAAQEAHEAIRPSDVTVKADDLKSLDESQRKLYDLIWRRFVACQMTNARYESVTTTVQAGDYELRIQGRVVVFDGFTRIWTPPTRGDDEQVVPDFQVGELLRNLKVEKTQHFTKPPARYREASLVRELEERGIGRPSTYVPIISTIQERGYVSLRQKRFHAERIGELVTDRLTENFAALMDYEFTSKMEQDELDFIALGKKQWLDVLDSFYGNFTSQLKSAEIEMRKNEPIPTSIACEKCGKNMLIRVAKSGAFLGCAGYDLPPKERCKHTMNLALQEESFESGDDEAESKMLRLKRKCPICATAMESFLLDETRKVHICGNQDCRGHEIEIGEFQLKEYEGPSIECDRCQGEMQRRTGRFGPFYSCTSETCGNTRKILANGRVAPPRADPVPMPELLCDGIDDHFVLRDGAAGLFLAASKYPRNRQTRAPLVKELLPHSNEIDPKFKHLLTAPVEDPSGRETTVRFSRKTQQHYIRVDAKGHPWSAHYENGRWVERQDVPKKTAARRSSKLFDGDKRV
ncbi:MAG: type I DNA topoisomerase [Gammaproteobacteria bacterium]|nr:type I DNA topoisomerase [Gammaproteobacteria bacterium]